MKWLGSKEGRGSFSAAAAAAAEGEEDDCVVWGVASRVGAAAAAVGQGRRAHFNNGLNCSLSASPAKDGAVSRQVSSAATARRPKALAWRRKLRHFCRRRRRRREVWVAVFCEEDEEGLDAVTNMCVGVTLGSPRLPRVRPKHKSMKTNIWQKT